MLRSGSRILHLLRAKERRARLTFWQLLMQVSGQGDYECPFTDEIPEGAVYFGVMPKYIRGAFRRAYELRADERRAEAEIYEVAISELLQEHFRPILNARKKRKDAHVGQFRIGKNWKVYAIVLN